MAVFHYLKQNQSQSRKWNAKDMCNGYYMGLQAQTSRTIDHICHNITLNVRNELSMAEMTLEVFKSEWIAI